MSIVIPHSLCYFDWLQMYFLTLNPAITLDYCSMLHQCWFLIRFEDGDEMLTNAIQQKETNDSGIRGSLFNQQQKQEHRGLVDDSGSTIDVMVVWTKKAECRKSNLAAGCTNTATTENNMRGLIALAVAETNTAYSLSGVTTQLRLVHAYREPNYVEATSDAFGAALSSITGTTDGVMDDVHTKRNTYGADVVALIIDDAAFCGMAYLGPSVGLMFSVTAWNCATGCKSNMHLFHEWYPYAAANRYFSSTRI